MCLRNKRKYITIKGNLNMIITQDMGNVNQNDWIGQHPF